MKVGLVLATVLVVILVAVDYSEGRWGGHFHHRIQMWTRECVWKRQSVCLHYRWNWAHERRHYYQCDPGWTHNGDQNCIIPICRRPCLFGSKCVWPNVCWKPWKWFDLETTQQAFIPPLTTPTQSALPSSRHSESPSGGISSPSEPVEASTLPLTKPPQSSPPSSRPSVSPSGGISSPSEPVEAYTLPLTKPPQSPSPSSRPLESPTGGISSPSEPVEASTLPLTKPPQSPSPSSRPSKSPTEGISSPSEPVKASTLPLTKPPQSSSPSSRPSVSATESDATVSVGKWWRLWT